MRQVTLRLPEDLVEQLKAAAAARDESLNRWVAAVLGAAVDPNLEHDEAARVRAKLRRAGLLVEHSGRHAKGPDDERLSRARAAAGRGRPLSEFVREGRR
ncbi:MAG: toxin-antitoxin system HicB family antitoxin [Actinomycetota bacterium]